jgi:hypothetical protein
VRALCNVHPVSRIVKELSHASASKSARARVDALEVIAGLCQQYGKASVPASVLPVVASQIASHATRPAALEALCTCVPSCQSGCPRLPATPSTTIIVIVPPTTRCADRP